MFHRPTVLLLGAGASAPYGMPIGPELISNIVKGLSGLPAHLENAIYDGVKQKDLDFFHSSSYAALVLYALSECPSILPADFCRSHVPWKKLANELRVSSHQSIDHFALINPAQSAVVRLLIAHEIGRHTYERFPNRGVALRSKFTVDARQGWYGKLVNHLRRGSRPPEAFLKKTNLNVVTFNYDRSLELFFEHDIVRGEIYRDLEWKSAIPIFHVHGAFDDAKIGSNFPHSFGACLLNSTAATTLVDFTGVPNTNYLIARRILADAEHIVVLGFDFDPANVEALNLGDPSIGSKIRTLNYAGSPGFRKRALEANVADNQIWSRGIGSVYEIATAIDDGIFDFG